MKTMVITTAVGLGLFGLGFVLGTDEITIANPMKTLAMTASVLFVIGGVSGIVYVWQNRPMRFRRTRRGRA